METSDYNDIYSAGNYAAHWGSSDLTNLAALQSASSKDAHSLSVYHHYLSDTDLHTVAPWLDGKGTVLSEVSDDIDGESRGSSVDIGADQFTPDPSTTTPLSGTYTIGSGGDYADFSSASADLLLKGISAPVTFNVISGNYNEQVVFHETPGASAANTITIQSQSGNAADVLMWYFASGNADNHIILLRGADYYRFNNMTFMTSNLSSVTYGRIFHLWGGLEDLIVEDNILNGSSTTSSNENIALIYGTDILSTPIIIRNNTFNNGGYSIYLHGVSQSNQASGTEISGNTINNGAYGMNFQYHQALHVTGNTIQVTQSSGIRATYCDGALQITKNKISVVSNYGLYLYLCDGGVTPTGTPGLIANNFVTTFGGGARGIYIVSSTYQNVYANSVNSVAGGGSRSFETSGGSNINVVNNIFANHGGGYAYYINNSSAVETSDYNDLFTRGTYLANWASSDITDLTALQTASSKDANSVSADPMYISNTDLHARAADVDSAATPLAEITDDIDDEARDALMPDIGADEFIFGFNYAPTITSTPDTSAMVDSLYQYQVTAEDRNGDTLIYRLTTAPAFLTIDSTSGLIQGTPAIEDQGEHDVVIEVDDQNGGKDIQEYTLTIESLVGISQKDAQIPTVFTVFQNYPNPFNPSTKIKFGLPKSEVVRIDIYNMLGQKITTLLNRQMAAGYHVIDFKAEGLSSGVYIYLIRAGSFNASKKMFLLK